MRRARLQSCRMLFAHDLRVHPLRSPLDSATLIPNTCHPLNSKLPGLNSLEPFASGTTHPALSTRRGTVTLLFFGRQLKVNQVSAEASRLNGAKSDASHHPDRPHNF